MLAFALPYALALVLLSLPYYNWLYYCGTALLWLIMLFASLIFVPSIVTRIAPTRGRATKIGLAALVLVAVFSIGPLSGGIKTSATHVLLEALYCDLSQPVPEVVLGGLREIGPHPPRTGAFEDTSFCLGPSCREQFITCADSKFQDLR